MSFTIAAAIDLEKTENLFPAVGELRVFLRFPWKQKSSDAVTDAQSARRITTKILHLLFKDYRII